MLKEKVLDEPTLVRMLVGQRFDIAIGNPFAIQLQAEAQGFNGQVQFLEPAVDRSPIYMAVSRRHPKALELASRLTGAIYEFKQTAAYQALLERYGM